MRDPTSYEALNIRDVTAAAPAYSRIEYRRPPSGTYEKPHQPPSGIRYVIVNGVVVM
jgi:hypothetical protein